MTRQVPFRDRIRVAAERTFARDEVTMAGALWSLENVSEVAEEISPDRVAEVLRIAQRMADARDIRKARAAYARLRGPWTICGQPVRLVLGEIQDPSRYGLPTTTREAIGRWSLKAASAEMRIATRERIDGRASARVLAAALRDEHELRLRIRTSSTGRPELEERRRAATAVVRAALAAARAR